jgi:hypothetical protein
LSNLSRGAGSAHGAFRASACPPPFLETINADPPPAAVQAVANLLDSLGAMKLFNEPFCRLLIGRDRLFNEKIKPVVVSFDFNLFKYGRAREEKSCLRNQPVLEVRRLRNLSSDVSNVLNRKIAGGEAP